MQSAHFVVGRLYQIVPHATTGLVGDAKANCMNPPDDHAGCLTSSSDEVRSFRRFGAANPDLNPAYTAWADPPQPGGSPSTGAAAGKYVYRYGLVPHDHINPVQGEGGGDREAPDQLSATAWVRCVVELGASLNYCDNMFTSPSCPAPHNRYSAVRRNYSLEDSNPSDV